VFSLAAASPSPGSIYGLDHLLNVLRRNIDQGVLFVDVDSANYPARDARLVGDGAHDI
jgi:hypothetical protein